MTGCTYFFDDAVEHEAAPGPDVVYLQILRLVEAEARGKDTEQRVGAFVERHGAGRMGGDDVGDGVVGCAEILQCLVQVAADQPGPTA